MKLPVDIVKWSWRLSTVQATLSSLCSRKTKVRLLSGNAILNPLFMFSSIKAYWLICLSVLMISTCTQHQKSRSTNGTLQLKLFSANTDIQTTARVALFCSQYFLLTTKKSCARHGVLMFGWSIPKKMAAKQSTSLTLLRIVVGQILPYLLIVIPLFKQTNMTAHSGSST